MFKISAFILVQVLQNCAQPDFLSPPLLHWAELFFMTTMDLVGLTKPQTQPTTAYAQPASSTFPSIYKLFSPLT